MKKGDVCIVNLAAGLGREQHGGRPAILISDTKIAIAVVTPMTSNLEALKFPYTLTVFPDKQNNFERLVGLLSLNFNFNYSYEAT